jgi:hypothetical protein
MILGLVAIAAAIYAIQFVLFHDARDQAFYLFQDLAFLPLNVLLVTLIVNRLLAERERAGQQHKMNMVIGAFLSSVGQPALMLLRQFLKEPETVCRGLMVDQTWDLARLKAAGECVRSATLDIHIDPQGLVALRDLLSTERPLLLGLLENPILLEHERFTDLLWAVFHLQEELSARRALADVAGADARHLAGDLERAYQLLLAQWLDHLAHLRADYPYLFSFSARMNPLRPDAHAEISGGE